MRLTSSDLSKSSISFAALVCLSLAFATTASAGDAPPVENGDTAAQFVRGDVDGSGKTNLTDSIALLDYLYHGGNELGCAAAADANDDESVDLADAVFALSALFIGSETLPAPWPEAGEDPTPGLACGDFHESEEKWVLQIVRPDLTVSSANWIWIGNTLYFRFYIKNQGLANAGSFKVSIRSETGALLETFSVSGLAKGATIVRYRTMPWIRCGHTATRRVTVDSGFTITESIETNNTRSLTYVAGPC
jgi:hypothetical protein